MSPVKTSSGGNLLASLIRHAENEKWCMKLFCTTCGAMRFRDEVKKIGIGCIADSMYSLDEEEVDEILEADGDPIGIIERDAVILYQGKNLWRTEKPLVVLKREAILQAKQRAKHERMEYNLQSEARKKVERQEKRALETERGLEYQQIAKQQRERILEEFSRLNLQEKLQAIADDTQHLPNYYPLQIEFISAEELDTISSEVAAKLLTRLSLLNSSRWDSIRQRLNALIAERLDTFNEDRHK